MGGYSISVVGKGSDLSSCGRSIVFQTQVSEVVESRPPRLTFWCATIDARKSLTGMLVTFQEPPSSVHSDTKAGWADTTGSLD